MALICNSPKPPYRIAVYHKRINILTVGYYYRPATGQLWPRISR